MGNIPHNFTHYWIGRFPRLLSHSYHALERCSHEPSFQHYYAHDVVFSKPEYFSTCVDNELAGGANGALDVNWRQSPGITTVTAAGGDALNWRSTAAPGQGVVTPKKTTTKKGAYNFRRPGEETNGTGPGAGGGGEGGVKKRKFYPRKE